jgi:hypothetical protein
MEIPKHKKVSSVSLLHENIKYTYGLPANLDTFISVDQNNWRKSVFLSSDAQCLIAWSRDV